MSVDQAVLRRRMVDNQLRPGDVTDHRILAAFADLPRDLFLPAHLRTLAYGDQDHVTPDGAIAMVAPAALARLLQALSLTPRDHLLDVSVDGGYAAAVASMLAGDVVALVRSEDEAARLSGLCRQIGRQNVRFVVGSVANGAPDDGPFDACLCARSVGRPDLLPGRQLRTAGRMAAMVDEVGVTVARLYVNEGESLATRRLFDAWAPPLPELQREHSFTFA